MCVVRGYVERIGERAYTAQPSGSGRDPHRRLNMWRGSCVSQGERESCVWGGMMYDGCGVSGQKSGAYIFRSNSSTFFYPGPAQVSA